MSQPDFKIEDKLATITLRAESRKNALDLKDLFLISQFLKKIKNKRLKCLIITGEGNTFSSGMDFTELAKGNWEENPISKVCDLIETLPFISICFLNGGVYGGSIELALSCDFRIGFNSTKLKIPAANFGIHYGVKGISRSIDAFGLALAKKILLLGHILEYEDLINTGFLDYYADDFEASYEILRSIVDEISEVSFDSIANMKATINDLRVGSINSFIEQARFTSGFKTGLIAEQLKLYKKERK